MMKTKYAILTSFCLCFFALSFFSSIVYAQNVDCSTDEKSLICPDTSRSAVYQDEKYRPLWNEKYIETSDTLNDMNRKIGWGLASFQLWILNGIDSNGNKIFEIFKNFFYSEDIQELKKNMNNIAMVLLPLFISVIGIIGIFGNIAFMKKAFKNLFFATLFIVVAPNLFSIVFESVPLIEQSFQTTTTGNVSDTLVLESIVDIQYYRKQLENNNSPKIKNDLDMQDLKYFDMTKRVDQNNFNRSIVGFDKLNNQPIVKPYDAKGFLGFGSVGIYQYYIDLPILNINLFLMLIIIIGLHTKKINILLNLLYSDIIKNIGAFFSTMNHTTLKKLFEGIYKTIFEFLALFLSMWFYIKIATFINTLNDSIILKILILIVITFYVLNSNKVVRDVFDIDDNMRTDGLQRAYYGMRMGQGLTRMAMKPLKPVGKLAGNFAHNAKHGITSQVDKGIRQKVAQAGYEHGENIADKRSKFLNSDVNYHNLQDDNPLKKYADPNYQYEGAKQLRKTGLSLVDNMRQHFYDKYSQDFSRAGRMAYEKRFPTSVDVSKMYAKKYMTPNQQQIAKEQLFQKQKQQKEKFKQAFELKVPERKKIFTQEEKEAIAYDWTQDLGKEDENV